MPSVQVYGAANPATTSARMRAFRVLQNDPAPGPAGATPGYWALGHVYVGLAMHGTPPWQAIGRRIWVDGVLSARQLEELLGVAEQSPLARTLQQAVLLRSAIDRLPRPDRYGREVQR